MLPTSPVAFQRPTTPSGETSPAAATAKSSLGTKLPTTTTSTLTLSVNTFASGATMSNSHSFTQMQTSDGASTTTSTTADDTGSKQSKQFASNPQLNSRAFEDNFSSCDKTTITYKAEVATSASSKNPFISFIPTLPGPPQSHSSSRKTQTPPSGSSGNLFYNGDNTGADKNSLPVVPHFHHRRNMSDTSTFGSRNFTTTAASGQQQQQHPPNIVPHHQRVRSLNPFEDPNYEDQLFGHEFDKIRSEGAKNVGKYSFFLFFCSFQFEFLALHKI